MSHRVRRAFHGNATGFLFQVGAHNFDEIVGGFFGGFVGTLLAIPLAGAIQVVVREVWQSTSPEAQLEIVGGDRPTVPVP